MALVGAGLILVFSATAPVAAQRYGNTYAMFLRQLAKAATGLGLLWVVLRMDYHVWQRLAKPLFWISVGLLALLVVPGTESVAPMINGTRRWLQVGPFNFQPSEMARFSLVVWMAAVAMTKADQVRTWGRGMAPFLAGSALLGGLVLLEPDLGGAGLLLLLGMVMAFLAGARLRHLAVAGLGGAGVLGLVLLQHPERLVRLTAFLQPAKAMKGAGYQAHQALIALGSGGLWGRGLGSSQQKYYFLPEVHTDFIYGLLGEELGLLGALGVLGAFCYFGYRGFHIAARSADRFGYLLGVGLVLAVLLSALVNIGVATAVLPTTGLALPFLSYGGSSLWMSLLATGVLLSLSRGARPGGRSRWVVPGWR